MLLGSLNRIDREPREQISVLSVLAPLWSSRPEVIDAIDRFLSRPMDSDTRITALKAVYYSLVDDYKIRRTVAAALDDTNAGVRLQAIGTLERMGPAALAEVQETLERLSQNPSESADVKSAARRAVGKIGK